MNITSTATLSLYGDAGAQAATHPPRPKPARISVARQVKQQRRGYATAGLRTLARTPPGTTGHRDHATLRGGLVPLGVRLTPATLRELAADIAAGRRVELPEQQQAREWRPGTRTGTGAGEPVVLRRRAAHVSEPGQVRSGAVS